MYDYMKQMLACIFLWLIPITAVFSEGIVIYQENGQKIDHFYTLNTDALASEEVLLIAQNVVKNREEYGVNVIAKSFSLLSDLAINRGETASAIQFAKFGVEQASVDLAIKISLYLKIAEGQYLQGQYLQLQETATKAVWLAEQIDNPSYHIQALAYGAVAYALLSDHQAAMSELAKIEHLLIENQQLSNHVAILEIMSKAHFNLAEYQETLSLLNKVIKLRTEMGLLHNIERTYYQIARSYYYLARYDDAYNAYWQTKKLAEEKSIPIYVAYAELGLGEVLFKQGQYQKAKAFLVSSKRIIKKQTVTPKYISNLIMLYKVASTLHETEYADSILFEAKAIAENTEVTKEQVELYLLLAQYYVHEKLYEEAYITQQQYYTLVNKFGSRHNFMTNKTQVEISSRDKSKTLALNLAEQSELSLRFNNKYEQQYRIIMMLSIVLLLFVLLYCIVIFKQRKLKLSDKYDDVESPLHKLANPAQTKNWYQQQFKMARKYQYDISVCYFIVENWQELTFHFKTKELQEVSKGIAVIINSYTEEFDYSGVINTGEYLILSPHQHKEEMMEKILKIEAALKVRFFANLGNYSVKINFAIDSPNIQDIDPFIFLSRLSECTRAEFVNQAEKVSP
jgi:tetratricopeptide (TPR) repeat protein